MNIKYNNQEAVTDLHCIFNLDDGELDVYSKAYTFRISCSPPYCDRGRFIVYAENNSDLWNPIDSQDFFPRYYFSLQRCLDELSDLIQIREKEIDFTSK